jgi:hypothetical protein
MRYFKSLGHTISDSRHCSVVRTAARSDRLNLDRDELFRSAVSSPRCEPRPFTETVQARKAGPMRIKCVVGRAAGLGPQQVDTGGIRVPIRGIRMLIAGTVVPVELSFNGANGEPMPS